MVVATTCEWWDFVCNPAGVTHSNVKHTSRLVTPDKRVNDKWAVNFYATRHCCLECFQMIRCDVWGTHTRNNCCHKFGDEPGWLVGSQQPDHTINLYATGPSSGRHRNYQQVLSGYEVTSGSPAHKRRIWQLGCVHKWRKNSLPTWAPWKKW